MVVVGVVEWSMRGEGRMKWSVRVVDGWNEVYEVVKGLGLKCKRWEKSGMK